MSDDPFKDFDAELDRRLKNVFNDVNAAMSAAQAPVPPPPPVPAAPFEYTTPFGASQTPFAAAAAAPAAVPPPTVAPAVPTSPPQSPLDGAFVKAPSEPTTGAAAPHESLAGLPLPPLPRTTPPPPFPPTAQAPVQFPPPPPLFVPGAVGVPVSIDVRS